MNEVQVRLCRIDQLVPYKKNARTHSDEQIAQIAASIQALGWTNPILVGPDNVVITGYARLAAARKLRLTEVPIIVLGYLTEAQRRAFVIADNQLALNAGWDEDFNLDLIGFEDEELADGVPPDTASLRTSTTVAAPRTFAEWTGRDDDGLAGTTRGVFLMKHRGGRSQASASRATGTRPKSLCNRFFGSYLAVRSQYSDSEL